MSIVIAVVLIAWPEHVGELRCPGAVRKRVA